MIKKLFGARRAPQEQPASIPIGQRVYAIGDVHGRLDLLDELLGRIDADDAGKPPAETSLIFLGDIVDRGPGSAGVVERLRQRAERQPGMRFLMGNHEEMFLAALDGDKATLRLFCRVGGRETILSYGMTAEEYDRLDYDELAVRMAELVPAAHRDFLSGFEAMIVVGDYAFVHAGVRPDTPLADQRTKDLRWIRSPFLDHRGRLEKIIVHGHTALEEVEYLPHRIGIDTGAYTTGRLTALGLEAGDRWCLQT